MREIKFKIYDKNDTNCIIGPFEWNKLPNFLYPTNFTLLQYTGKRDVNGKEIYEGDIIKLGAYYYEIVWEDYAWACDDHGATGQSTNTQKMNGCMTDFCKIVGNIFENADLIKH